MGTKHQPCCKESQCPYGTAQTGCKFWTKTDDLKNIYVLYVRSHLDQSCVVWHSSLTEQNKSDLERVQRSALKIILGEGYESYSKALNTLNLVTLE